MADAKHFRIQQAAGLVVNAVLPPTVSHLNTPKGVTFVENLYNPDVNPTVNQKDANPARPGNFFTVSPEEAEKEEKMEGAANFMQSALSGNPSPNALETKQDGEPESGSGDEEKKEFLLPPKAPRQTPKKRTKAKDEEGDVILPGDTSPANTPPASPAKIDALSTGENTAPPATPPMGDLSQDDPIQMVDTDENEELDADKIDAPGA